MKGFRGLMSKVSDRYTASKTVTELTRGRSPSPSLELNVKGIQRYGQEGTISKELQKGRFFFFTFMSQSVRKCPP